MNEPANLVSKVLVLDDDVVCYDRIKSFCDATNLVGLKIQSQNAMSVLKSNVDLGGILLSENYGGRPKAGIQLARKIHAIRSELPIFLRRESASNLDDLSAKDRKPLSAGYTIDSIDALRPMIDEYIFSRVYPNVLVRGIAEITKTVLESQFKDSLVEFAAPYIVRDRLVFGEIYTLIPIESSWCRGYMMLQAEESSLISFVKADKTPVDPGDVSDFRNLNGLLGEITNLFWGAFKSRFIADEARIRHLSQVPIIINHLHRYISFGSDNAQLCFKYTLSDPSQGDAQPLVMYQKFVFNMSWSPEDFRENQISVDSLVESGELELF